MAKLDQILLKTSKLNQKELIEALEGTGRDSRDRIEKGETVLRYSGAGRLNSEGQIEGEPTGLVELWTVNDNDQAVQVYVDFGAVIPPWDPAELANASISQLGDVDFNDGIGDDGPGFAEAGKVLTWDGAKMVLRDPPQLGEGGAILETLNNVGDVNYGYYSPEGKFGPELGDILLYQYNSIKAKYEWAPTKLEIGILEGFSGPRNGNLVIDRAEFSGIEFGNPVSTQTDSAAIKASGSQISMLAKDHSRRIGNSNRTVYTGFVAKSTGDLDLQVGPGNDIVLKPQAKDGGLPGGFRYDTVEDVPDDVPGPNYFTTLSHVDKAIARSQLGVLANVNDTGILQGQVLTWDSLSQQYRPASGIAPDLSQASLEDLQDVNGQNKGRGKPLTWNDTQGTWIPETLLSRDLEWDNNPAGFYASYDTANADRCDECDQDNLGAFTVVENTVFVCLRVRSEIPPLNSQDPNDAYDWVKILVDGYNTTVNKRLFAPDEYRAPYGFNQGKDPLKPIAYEGTLGALSNVSTADVFNGAAPVYNPSTASFEMGYPALDLASYSVGDLGDVNLQGAGVGYGLLWNGQQWEASSLDQKVRLDDLQDVQFGSLGVTNTKLVAAFMLAPSQVLGPTYVYNQDVSTTLAVSTPKDNYFPGSTNPYYFGEDSFGGGQAPTQGGTAFFNWRASPPMSVAELLDLYVRWPKDNSWQTIDGDGVIELYFYPNLFLDTRTILRRVSVVPGSGGYILQLTQDGGIRFQVSAPTGEIGFTLTSTSNFVSLNNWHHVALVKEGASNRMYLDGSLVDEQTSTTPWTGDDMFVLGRNDLDDGNTLTQQFFRGYMSDLRVTKGRSKYTGSNYSQPASIEDEIVDTTPNAGDFLSYDGTKWTNVAGVDADITNKSINELNDVDTGSNDPAQGDALVWTGAQWEPGIPGIGATWSLNDMTDVETFYGSGGNPIRLSQAETLYFSNAFNASADTGNIQQIRSGDISFGLTQSWTDCSWTCDPFSPCGNDGEYSNARTTSITTTTEGRVNVRAQRMTINNVFTDCSLANFIYHEDALHYAKCPDRSYEPAGSGNPYGDIPGAVEETFIPCWGVIQDHVDEILPYGLLAQLGDVGTTAPTLGQALAWDGLQWAPSSSIAADVSNNELNDLGNVNVAGASLLDVLKYDGATWIAEPAVADLGQLPDVAIAPFAFNTPINVNKLRNPPSSNPDANEAPILNTIHGNGLLDIGSDGGLKGITWQGNGNSQGGSIETHANGTTRFSSGRWNDGLSSTPYETWIELNKDFIRFSGDGNNWGAQGFLLDNNLIIRYENQTRVLADYGVYDVAPKGLIVDYIDSGLSNLDLSPNTLEQLGNVDTAGKGNGYALVWNGTEWGASPSIAADISLSSIGELRDVTLVDNSDLSTNDGALTFEVGEFRTTAPHQDLGGIELTNQNGTARIGWSGVWDGSPIMANTANTSLASFVRVQELEIQVQASGGFRYTQDPGLTDSTIPSWSQVKQQIARQASDYTALFFMDGNTFTERNYGWPLNVQVTTQPNPQYFAPFADQYSYNIRKINQDKFSWAVSDGARYEWNTDTLWSVEMWVFVSAADAGDTRMEYILAPIGDNAGGTTTGLHLGLCGDERNRIFFTLGSCNATINSGGRARPTNTYLSQVVEFDQWHHVYVAHEGTGRNRFFIDGDRVGEIQQNSSFTMDGGLSFGGREQLTGDDTGGYLTGALDDIRITQGWIPYPADRLIVPIPVEPLPPGAWKAAYGTLDALEDVQTSGEYEPTNGQVLTWNNVAQAWRPASEVAYDISTNSLTDLTDVDTTNSVPDQDDILRWDVAEEAWRRTKIDGNGGVSPLVQRTATPGIIPTPAMLKAGEMFLNMADKKMYALDSAGEAFSFATGDLDTNGILDAVDTTYDRVVGGTF